MATAPESAGVSRAALGEIVDAYSAALVARDARRLPLADTVRFTENMQTLPLSEGLWGTATGTVEPQLVLLDPAGQSAALLGLAYEHDEAVGLGVRLRLDRGRISEIETLVVRQGTMIFNPDGMRGTPIGFGPVAPGSRASRETLRAAANAYFDGIENNRGDIIPVEDSCIRMENGVQTVLAPASNFGSSTAAQGLNLFEMGLRDQMDSGFFDYIPRVRSRRFPVIDEEQGLVLGMCCFDQPGTVTTVEVKNVGPIILPPMFRRPTSVGVFETFQVADGKIRTINAVFDFYPYGIPMGW
jgi:hypothetical protein